MMQRLLRTLFMVLALALPMSQASAANFTVRSDNLQGWAITPDGTVPYAFLAGPAATGTGSLQFGPIDGTVPANKFLMLAPLGNTPMSQFLSFSIDYYVDPASLVGSDHFYINVYVDSASNGIGTTASFYDCRFDLVAPAAQSTGTWHTLSFNLATAWTNVANPLGTCPATLGGLTATDVIQAVVVNGGQSTAADAGLMGGFDNAVIVLASATDVYDFEPLPLVFTPSTPVPTMSEWALIVLAMLMLGAGVVQLRRRRID